MGVHDLNFDLHICDASRFDQPRVPHEHWQNTVCASHGVRALEELWPHHRSIWRRLGCAHPELRRFVSCHGLYAVDVARILARYRGLSQRQSVQADSHGYEGCACALDAGRRAGLHHHRLVPESVRLGAVSHHQSGGEDAHALDLRGSIPAFIHISDGKMGDVKVLDILPVEAGAFYVMDRGYLDFTRLYKMHQAGAFFVTRAKRGMNARRVYSSKTDRTSGVVCDQTIAMNGFYIAKDYPEHLRRIRFKDPESGKTLVFLTNNTALPPADYRRAVQELLAGRTVLQVNQATPAHQTLFGHQRERRQDANLVRRVDLRDDCYRQEGASFGGLALHIATDFVGVGFRENPDFMRPAARCPHNRNTSPR